jgi:hypothetical protein
MVLFILKQLMLVITRVYNRAEPTFPDNPVTGVRKKFYGWSPNANVTKILKDTTFLAEFREVHKITWTNEGAILERRGCL